ncbi:MAG: extensin family protein [Proteobacteria bacterium]|nr:extensin family protein [Pseudomonadota bacterium]
MRLAFVVVIVGGTAGACSDAAPGGSTKDPVALAFAAPMAGASFARDHVSSATAALVATIGVSVAIEGAPARVGLTVDDVAQPDLDPTGAGTVEVAADTATLVATAYDDADQPVATAQVVVGSTDVTPADCHAALDLWGVTYTPGPAKMGVVDPVTAQVPLHGLAWRAIGATAPRTTQYGDCTLILSLARATPILRAHGVVEVADYGIYNYRCIGGGAPPCANGISQHAMATAIDLAAFTTTSGDTAVVNDDWVIDPDPQETCAAPTEPGKDTFLHQLICALDAARVWNIILTPNYNADHRNHFHVDLTPATHFIE